MKCIISHKRKLIICIHILCILVVAFIFFRYLYKSTIDVYGNIKEDNIQNISISDNIYHKRISPAYESSYIAAPSDTEIPKGITIYSKSFAVFNLTKEMTIFGHNTNEKIYPASTTKLLTALVAAKYGDFNKKYTVSHHALEINKHSSKANLKEGDKVTLNQLIAGMLIPSGNDAAVALAEAVAGNEKEFINLMNETAKEIGVKNSNFETVNGLHKDNHYTTAFDMHLITREAIENPTLLKILSKKSYTTKITDKYDRKREVTWKNTNLFESGDFKLPKNYTLIGGKTGNTDEAKRCLVLITKNKNDEIILTEVFGVKSRDNVYRLTKKLLKSIK